MSCACTTSKRRSLSTHKWARICINSRRDSPRYNSSIVDPFLPSNDDDDDDGDNVDDDDDGDDSNNDNDDDDDDDDDSNDDDDDGGGSNDDDDDITASITNHPVLSILF